MNGQVAFVDKGSGEISFPERWRDGVGVAEGNSKTRSFAESPRIVTVLHNRVSDISSNPGTP